MVTNFLLISVGLTIFAVRALDTYCRPPYECLPLNQCAERLSADASDQLLFRCQNRTKICCPPLRPTTRIPPNMTGRIGQDSYTAVHHREVSTTERIHKNCSICGSSNNKITQATSPVSGKRMTTPSPKKKTSPSPEINNKSHRNIGLLPTNCGSSDLANRITEGEEASLGEFPWMALVGLKDWYGAPKWICGGTLINQRYVLTAAHCVYRENNTKTVIRLGEHNLDNSTDCDKVNHFCLDSPLDVDVEEIIVHPGWNSTTIKNDIALFRLSQNVSESFSVSPICLPVNLKKRNASAEIKYEVAGWGKTEWNAQLGSNVLRKAVLSAVSNQDCNLCKSKKKELYCPITEKQLCAQGYKSVDVCKGDSGGPLMISQLKVYQLGITSFKASEYCGADNIPSIFTNVKSYMGWILDNIRE